LTCAITIKKAAGNNNTISIFLKTILLNISAIPRVNKIMGL
jgi:hypothetical protein